MSVEFTSALEFTFSSQRQFKNHLSCLCIYLYKLTSVLKSRTLPSFGINSHNFTFLILPHFHPINHLFYVRLLSCPYELSKTTHFCFLPQSTYSLEYHFPRQKDCPKSSQSQLSLLKYSKVTATYAAQAAYTTIPPVPCIMQIVTGRELRRTSDFHIIPGMHLF